MPPKPKRRRAAHSTDAAPKSNENPRADHPEIEASPWPTLPTVVVSKVLTHLNVDDMVSVGQTCQAWRAAAKNPGLWKRRKLEYLPLTYRNRHRDAYRYKAWYFARVVRFAPCLDLISCNTGMKPGARKALIKQSECEPRCVELNGGLVSTVQYLQKWRNSIEEATLVNPTECGFKAAAALSRLQTLCIWAKSSFYYVMPPYPADCIPQHQTLKRLVFSEHVTTIVVNAMVQVYAASLEELCCNCSVPEALPSCASLRNLEVDLDPTKDETTLRDLLRKRKQQGGRPLEKLTFFSLGVHDKETCASFGRTLREDEGLVIADAVIECLSCNRGYALHPDPHRPGRYV